MKVYINKGGMFCARAETLKDISILMSSQTETGTSRKHKKNRKVTCKKCGITCLGKLGLGVHSAKAHKKA